MYARRFLIFIFVLTLLAVLGALLMFQFGGSVLRDSFTPRGSFTTPPPRSGPDYGLANSWLARPDVPANPAGWLPEGVEQGGGEAAIFYIHPTTYLRGDRWNAPIQEPDSDRRGEMFVRSQASAFSSAGEVWAPRYRQAAYGAFLLNNEDAQKALDLAYSDISAAFDEFLRKVPADKPIILAGHSQGALHLIRLLRERKSQFGGRLVAAYAPGWPIDSSADLPALGLPGCVSPDESGCLLSWMSFGDPPNPDLILAAWQEQEGLTGAGRSGEWLLCVNPLTGKSGDSAPPAANPGTLVPNADFSSAALVAGAVGARCDGGLLIIDGELPPLGPFVLPGNNYHVYDYALFWGAIREDAERRLKAWRG